MMLDEYYFGDPRVVLVPVEHLGSTGMTPEFAARAAERAGWSAATIALFDAAFTRYWERAASLARRTATWPPPRRRHIVVVGEPRDVIPWVQLLNTSAWLVYASDLDPARSDPEFLAFLLAHGDWMVQTGEVAMAGVRGAAWWLERSDDECAAFATAAAQSTRPDAAAWRALAEALPWLRQLHHETLRPPRIVSPRRPIPGTGLLVSRALEREPPRLAERWTEVARDVLASHRAAWRRHEPAAVRDLTDWLAGTAPPLLVTGAGGTVLWDPDVSARVAPVRDALDEADAVAVRAIHADLEVVAERSEAFLGAVADVSALPAPQANTFQSGYSYLHATRRLVAYNLHEPGMDRLHGPPLPFAREMVGAHGARVGAPRRRRRVGAANGAERRVCDAPLRARRRARRGDCGGARRGPSGDRRGSVGPGRRRLRRYHARAPHGHAHARLPGEPGRPRAPHPGRARDVRASQHPLVACRVSAAAALAHAHPLSLRVSVSRSRARHDACRGTRETTSSTARGSRTISSPRACSTRHDSRRSRRQSDGCAPATPSIARDSACPPTDRARWPHDSAAAAG